MPESNSRHRTIFGKRLKLTFFSDRITGLP